MTIPSASPHPAMARPRVPFPAAAAPVSRTRWVILFLLVFVTYVSPPRFNVGTVAAPGALPKTVDVRAEDLLLVAILSLWMIRPSFVRWRSPLKPLIFGYLAWSITATVFAISQEWVSPLRATFYTAKEIEYFLFFAVGLLCVRSIEDLRAGIAALVAGALVQGLYAVYQLGTGQYTGGYAVGLLGEANPHAVGFCGLLSLCLGMALFDPARPRMAAVSIACAGLGAVQILGSVARTAAIAAVVAAVVLLVVELPDRRRILPRWAPVALFSVMAVAAVVTYTLLSASEKEADMWKRRMDPLLGAQSGWDEGVKAFHQTRVDYVFVPYYELVARSPILGNGKGITGQSEDRFAETHNYYLRLIVEAGIVGLLLYMIMLAVVLGAVYRLYRYGRPMLARRMGLFCLVFTVVILVCAFAQDTFSGPRAAELFWIMAGMAMGLDRLGLSRQPRPASLRGLR